MDLIFRDVGVSIGSVPILQKVSGMAKQGDMLAVMGPSGAGKSTLLNAVSGRLPVQSGQVTLNGEPINRKMRRKICYVLQQDVFFANLTLKETLTFSALLRLPDKMPRKMKNQRVEDIIDLLDLRKCMNTAIGGIFVPGLSGGEKKRASIACELITNPALIMLDEPTSGLDAAIAFQLMRTMKHYTEESNKTVIATIHQPSSQIFHMFDNVLLLANGQVAYFGKSSKIVEFFSSINLTCALNYNPADFILEKVKESEEVLTRIIDAANNLRKSEHWPQELRSNSTDLTAEDDLPEVKVVDTDVKIEDITQNGTCRLLGSQEEIAGHVITSGSTAASSVSFAADPVKVETKANGYNLKIATESHNIDHYYVEGAKWQTCFMTQFITLTRRNFAQSKNRILSKLNIGQTLFLAIFCGVVWFLTPRTEVTLPDRNGLIFFSVVYFGFVPMFDAITSFPEERGVINKERSAGAYRLTAYYFAKMLSESPLTFALPIGYLTIIYWMGGLAVNAGAFISQILLFLYHSLISQSIGFFIGVTFDDFKLSITVGACFMLTSLLAGGYYQTNFPFWMEWAKYVSYLQYTFQASLYTEYHMGAPIQCAPANKSVFASCAANLTTEISGDEYLQVSGNTLPIWVDIIVMLGVMIAFRVAGYLVLRYYRSPARKAKSKK